MTTTDTPQASTTKTEHRNGVVVVGGGYAGLHAVRAIESTGVAVTLVDRSGNHDFVTRLAAVAGGAAPIEDASQPLGRFAADIEIGSVATVADGAVALTDGRRIEADAVVITAGAEPSQPPIDGLEHAATLRTGDDALFLRTAIAAAPSVVIVGGGATGVQLAGAIAHAHRYLPVHLVETGDRLLPGLPASIGDGAERILTDRNVEIHLGQPADRITPDGVQLDDEFLPGLVVWAGGFSADAERLGVPTTDEGRIIVDSDLRIAGMDRTFAAGDIAAHTDPHSEPLAMSAQIAVQAGTAAGRNAVHVIRDEPTESVSLRQRGWIFDLSGHRGLAQLGPFEFTHPVADLIPPRLHDLVDLKNLVEIGGVRAFAFAPESVRSIIRLLPLPTSSPTPAATPTPA